MDSPNERIYPFSETKRRSERLVQLKSRNIEKKVKQTTYPAAVEPGSELHRVLEEMIGIRNKNVDLELRRYDEIGSYLRVICRKGMIIAKNITQCQEREMMPLIRQYNASQDAAIRDLEELDSKVLQMSTQRFISQQDSSKQLVPEDKIKLEDEGPTKYQALSSPY